MNLLGAAIFWLYIVAALLFTALVLDTIFRQASTPPALRKHVAAFSILALASFALTSFNMLHVLIQSYVIWSAQTSTIALLRAPVSLSKIWTWSASSTLFRDFGEAIVANDVRFLWVQWALLATLSICLYMGAEGVRHRIPRLWAFFALSQILPISFAQNLFYVAILRSSRTAPQIDVGLSRNFTIRIIAAYCVCLAVAPYTAGKSGLMLTILLARVLLLLPLNLAEAKDHRARSASGRTLFTLIQAQQAVAVFVIALTVKQSYLIQNQSKASLVETWQALFSHPAVSALGVDFLMSAGSFVTWTLCQKAIRDSMLVRKKDP